MFKKKVGRPSNKYKRKIRNIKLLGTLSIISIVGITIFILNNTLKNNNLKGDITSVPKGSIIQDYQLHKCAINGYNDYRRENNLKEYDYNHRLTSKELSKIKKLICYNVKDLSKMRYFRNVESVLFNNAEASVVDFSYNKKLKKVEIDGGLINYQLEDIKLPFDNYIYNNSPVFNSNCFTIYRVDTSYESDYNHSNLYNLTNSLIGDGFYNMLDYNVNLRVPANAGEYKINFKPINEYYWNDGTNNSKTITYKINPINITKKHKKISIPSQIYTGSELKPDISFEIKLNKYDDDYYKLENGKDYTLTYKNNIKVGSNAQVTITGIGNYTGSITKKFVIKERKKQNNDSFLYKIDADDRLLKGKCDSSPVQFTLTNKKHKKIDKNRYDFSVELLLEKAKDYNEEDKVVEIDKKNIECVDDKCNVTIKNSYKNFYINVYDEYECEDGTTCYGKAVATYGPFTTCVNNEQALKNKAKNDSKPKLVTTMKINMSKKTGERGCYGVGVKAKITAKYKIKKVEVLTDNKKTWETSNKCTKNNNVVECTVGKKYYSLKYRVTTSNNEYQEFGPFCIK